MKKNWKKNTAVFLISQAISIFGSSLVQFAITWYITLTTKSGIYSMLAIVFGILPMFFLSPFAGVWADRYNRKKLIVFADGGIALCTLVVALFFLTGRGSLWLLFVALAIRAVGGAVQTPAVNAMLPSLVPPEHLTRINGLYGSIQSLITLLSPMLSGALLGFASLEVIFFIDVVTAALAIIVMLVFFHLPAQPNDGKAPTGDYYTDLKLGIAYIKKHPYLRSFFLFCSIYFFMAAPVAFLTPLQAARNYGGEVWHLTAIEVAFSLGMTIGGLGVAAWGGLKNRTHNLVISSVVMGLCTILLGFPIRFWFYIGLMGIFGLVMPLFNTPAMVLLQERVDPDYMGRIFGIVVMINTGMMPLGMLIFGPLADVIAIEWLLLGTGAVMLGLAYAIARNKPLLQAGLPLPAAPQPPAASTAS